MKTEKATESQTKKAIDSQKEKMSDSDKEKASVMPQTADNMVDRVIHNITEDQTALEEQNDLIDKAKSYKREIQDRLRDAKRDLITFVKYMTPTQLETLNKMGIDTEELGSTTNPVAKIALDVLGGTPKGEMTNEALYDAYVKTFKHPEDAFNYTEFNIKCRSLFNSQRLLRKEPADAKTSREHIISINGFKPTIK